jgi:hypothetical protein
VRQIQLQFALSCPTPGAGNPAPGQVASGPGSYYADCVRNAALRAFRKWVLWAVVAFVVTEIVQQVLHGHWLTLPVIGESIAAATWGRLSCSAGMAVARRIRGRRAAAVHAAHARQPSLDT